MELKNIKKIILSIVLIVSISTIITSLLVYNIIIPTKIQVNNLVYEDDYNKTMKIIEEVAFNLSMNEYILDVYDCKNFSKDLVWDLYDYNIKSYCIKGFVRDENKFFGWGSHMWTGVIINNLEYPIEATSGLIIDNETYISDYFIVNKGYCL